MPLSQIPPWLDVRPEQFVHAAAAGAEAGLAVARMNQAGEEAAATMAQRGEQFQAEQALRKWEHEQQMQMHAEQMAQQSKQQQAALEARTAYNMANLGLRQSLGEQNIKARTSSESRLGQQLDLSKQRLDFSKEQEKRRQALAVAPEVKAQISLLTDDYKRLNASKQFETDPQKLAEIDRQMDDKKQQIIGLLKQPEVPAPGGAEAGGIPAPMPSWAQAPAGGQPFAPGMQLPPELGGAAAAPEAAPVAPTAAPAIAPGAPETPPTPNIPTTTADDLGWKTVGKYRYSMDTGDVQPPADDEQGTGP